MVRVRVRSCHRKSMRQWHMTAHRHVNAVAGTWWAVTVMHRVDDVAGYKGVVRSSLGKYSMFGCSPHPEFIRDGGSNQGGHSNWSK